MPWRKALLLFGIRHEHEKIYNKIEIMGFASLAIVGFIGMFGAFQSDSTLQLKTIRQYVQPITYVFIIFSILALIKSFKLTYIVFVPIIYWFIITVDNYYGLNMGNILLILELGCFLALPERDRAVVYGIFRILLVASSIVAILCFISYVLNGPLPYKLVEYYNQRGSNLTYYADYYICSVHIDGSFSRLCGVFNEPGFMGTITALTLVIEDFNLSKIGNIALLVAGILSFSIAFFVICLLYFVLRMKYSKISVCLVVTFAILYFFVLPNIQFDNVNITKFLDRAGVYGNGFVSTERSNSYIDFAFKTLASSDYWLWGYGGGYSSANLEYGTLTVKTWVIDYGFLGFALMYGSVIVAAVFASKRNWRALSLVLCFTASIIQRPSIFLLAYFIVLFGGIANILETDDKSLMRSNADEGIAYGTIESPSFGRRDECRRGRDADHVGIPRNRSL